ncbi:MAG: HlyD family efflux transporter periplasmic adaptor subunit [Rubripirellula sp.]
MSSATANQPFVFSPGAAPAATGTDPLVDETRREIAEIVREVAAAVRSDRTEDDFLGMLSDRLLRAMAAEGVIVWQRTQTDSQEPNYRSVRRIGRVTDQSIPRQSQRAHQRLLTEVADAGQPVVVPATPGASDTGVPANPMHAPAAVVPIELETSLNPADYLLEVFLEPDCGVATQRGYLRFVAQMADLAGEFLRADQLRRLKRIELIREKVDAAIVSLHQLNDTKKLQAAIVDATASLFDFDRVGLCSVEPNIRLLAVSHVETIDRNSPAADQISQAADYELDADGCIWLAAPEGESIEDGGMVVRTVSGEDDSPYRLIGLQTADSAPTPSEFRSELLRFTQHADYALMHQSRLDAIPGARIWASLAPAGPSSIWKPIVLTATLMTIVLVIGLFPVPLVVYSTATVLPENVQTISAPRQAVVDQVHVKHGQQVLRGERLLSLVDSELDAQIATLMGRRSVLMQQQSHWTDAMVDTASNRMDRLEQVQGEQRLITEEIQSIDDQLSILNRVLESLVIRADRNGTVDAWQIEQRLASRPLQRGELLLQVIADRTPWMVEASVMQSRIAHVQNAKYDSKLVADVALESDPNRTFPASLVQIGPSSSLTKNAQTSTAVLLRLSEKAAQRITAEQGSGNQSGAPARVVFRCGKTPVAYLLFQDLIRSVRGTIGLYFGGDSGSEGDRA